MIDLSVNSKIFSTTSEPLNDKGVQKLADRLETGILEKIPDSAKLIPDDLEQLPNTVCIYFKDINGELLKEMLFAEGIKVTTGSGCGAMDLGSANFFEELDIPYEHRAGSILFSLSKLNTAEEIEKVLETLPNIVARLRLFTA